MKDYSYVFTLEDVDRIANEFLSVTNGLKHFTFFGAMGSGKTTLITSICRILGSNDLVSSPSFAIINEYSSEKEDPIFHFDFYRIKDPVELLDIGFNEYCSANAYCFIEWPEKGESIIPEDFIRVDIQVLSDKKRMLSFKI